MSEERKMPMTDFLVPDFLEHLPFVDLSKEAHVSSLRQGGRGLWHHATGIGLETVPDTWMNSLKYRLDGGMYWNTRNTVPLPPLLDRAGIAYANRPDVLLRLYECLCAWYVNAQYIQKGAKRVRSWLDVKIEKEVEEDGKSETVTLTDVDIATEADFGNRRIHQLTECLFSPKPSGIRTVGGVHKCDALNEGFDYIKKQGVEIPVSLLHPDAYVVMIPAGVRKGRFLDFVESPARSFLYRHRSEEHANQKRRVIVDVQNAPVRWGKGVYEWHLGAPDQTHQKIARRVAELQRIPQRGYLIEDALALDPFVHLSDFSSDALWKEAAA